MIWGSVIDAFSSFDPDYVGDAGPIARRIDGEVGNINWLVSSSRLLIGAELNEYAIRSSFLDEPLTPTTFNIKATSSQGSAKVQPALINANPVFVSRTGMRVFEDSFNTDKTTSLDFALVDLCALVPEIGKPSISRMAGQHQPDKRVHCVRSDGTVALLVYDDAEEVMCWCEIETDGEVEDAIVLPAQTGVTDDYVYYIVKRIINGSTVRYLEKWEQAANTVGGVGEPSAGVNFFEYSDSTFVATGSHSDNRREFYYVESKRSIYYPDAVDGLIYIHNIDDWTSPATTINTGEAISENNYILNREETHLWLGGEIGAGTNIRVVEIATGTTTTLTTSGTTYEITAAWMQGSDHYIVVSNNTLVQVYKPNLSTGLLGAVIRQWSVSPGANSISTRGNRGAWATADNTLWYPGAQLDRRMYHVDPAQAGALYYHEFPPSLMDGLIEIRPDSNVVYDSLRNRVFILLTAWNGAANTTWKLLTYSNWGNANNSGEWAFAADFALDSGQATISYLDPVSDVLIVEGANRIYRFIGSSMRLIDITSFADLGITDYDVAGNHSIYYIGSCVYTRIRGSAGGPFQFQRFFGRICFNGPQMYVNSLGESLIPGGSSGRLNGLADSFVVYDDPAPITTVTGLDHLEGKEVVVWANGVDLGTTATYGQTYTVSGGSITLASETTNIVVGLPYTAQFQSSKLGLVMQQEIMFGKEKRIAHIALVLADTHAKGVRFGPDFNNLDDRPENEGWTLADADRIDAAYDSEMIEFPGGWATDARICLQAHAPRPCTVLAVKLDMEV